MTMKEAVLLWATDNTRTTLLQLAERIDTNINFHVCDSIEKFYDEICSQKIIVLGAIIELNLIQNDVQNILEYISNQTLAMPLYLISDARMEFVPNCHVQYCCYQRTKSQLQKLLSNISTASSYKRTRSKSSQSLNTGKPICQTQKSYERVIQHLRSTQKKGLTHIQTRNS